MCYSTNFALRRRCRRRVRVRVINILEIKLEKKYHNNLDYALWALQILEHDSNSIVQATIRSCERPEKIFELQVTPEGSPVVAILKVPISSFSQQDYSYVNTCSRIKFDVNDLMQAVGAFRDHDSISITAYYEERGEDVHCYMRIKSLDPLRKYIA